MRSKRYLFTSQNFVASPGGRLEAEMSEESTDPSNSSGESSGADSFSQLLAGLRGRANRRIAEPMARDPATIDLAGHIDWMPRVVIEALVSMKDQLNDESRAALEQWQERERQRARELWEQFERAERAFRRQLPPNWNSPEIGFPSLEQLETLQFKEGLPLAWLPPNRVLSALLLRRTSGSRRRLLAQESSEIVASCLAELRRLRSAETKEWRASAREAALVMKSGYWRAGQALAALALETLTDKFVRVAYSDATTQSRNAKGAVKVATPPGSLPRSLPTWRDADYPRALLVLHGIFGAFAEYDRRGDEPVPSQFTRHGTIHSVGGPQYSKANAVIALMHLVGLLCLIGDD